jgi:hypothetical protein
MAAVRSLLGLVQRTGSGELHLVLDPARGLAVRIRHDGNAAAARLVPPRHDAATTGPTPTGAATAVPPGPEPARALRPQVRQELADLRRARRRGRPDG